MFCIGGLCLQSRHRDTVRENKCMDTKIGKGGRMDWEIETDAYTLVCIKWASQVTQVVKKKKSTCH